MVQRVRIKRMGVLSTGVLLAVLYALLGLLFGALVSLIFLLGGAEGGQGLVGGALAIVLFPILYGLFGFIMGVIVAFLYNLVAGWVGGIQLELEQQ